MLSRTALSVDDGQLHLYSDVRELEGIRLLYQYNASVWDDWAKHIKKGGKVVGTLANSPIELLRAAGVFSIIYKRREDLNRTIIKGDYDLGKWIYHFGVGECVCRYVSGGAGSPILGACPGYDLVITDFLPKLPEWHGLIKKIGKDWDFMHLELERGMSRRAREKAIYDKLIDLKARLEGLTGKKITDDDVSRSIEVTNEVTRTLSEIDGLVKAEPHPMKSFDIYNLKVILTDYIGGNVDRLLGACYLLRDELVERVEAGVGYDGKKILLAGGFRNEFLHAIDGNAGMVTAGWPYQRFTSHREPIKGDNLEALAEWYAGHAGVGTAEENAKGFAELVRHHDVDAVIYNRQCPFGSLEVYDSHDAIRNAVDLPFLTIAAEDEAEVKIGEFLRKL